MSLKSTQIKPIDYTCRDKTLTFIKPLVMAIVNMTPDSFYDGGKYENTADVLADVEEKINMGADIIDIGACSTRPNADTISEEEEWNRLKDVLKEIRKKFPNVFISVDTYRASIAEKSAALGADMINDIGGGTLDNSMFETVAKLNLPYVLMQIRGTPQTMQNNPRYTNVLNEVADELQNKINSLRELNFNKIIIDPGFGFGKSVEDNYRLLKHISDLNEENLPVLAGLSRKSVINKIIGSNPVTALNGTSVLNTIALLNGASILRVHDVKEAKEVIKLVEFYKNV